MLKLSLLVCFTVNVFVDSIPLEKHVIQERIIGGNDTDISQFPHQVAIYVQSMYLCGGFIVSPTHIVTAAGCFREFDLPFMTIRAGSSSSDKGGETLRVKKIDFHPKYKKESHDYDAMVLELNTPLKINNKTIKPIKLATKEPSVGSIVSVSGWGQINEDGKSPNTLQSLAIPVVDRTKCANLLIPHNVTVTPRMICAGAQEKNVNLRDGGSALVYNGEVVGITTHAVGAYSRYLPGVYTNIVNPEINKFIKDIAKL